MAVVSVSGLGISRPLAVVVSSVAPIAIASVSVSTVSISVTTEISGLGISRPLAIIMMSIGVRSVSVSVSTEISGLGISSGLSSGGGLSLSLSGPLAVVVASVATIVASIASTVASIPAITIVAGLGSNNSEEDDGESNQKFHVVRSSFST